jgi:hypothetical protein
LGSTRLTPVTRARHLAALFIALGTAAALSIPTGCSSSACDTAVTALCHRSNECSGKNSSVFVTGTSASYTVVDYGTIGSCEDQLGPSCPSTAAESDIDACEQAAFDAECGEVPTAKGARLPAVCEGIIILPPPPS